MVAVLVPMRETVPFHAWVVNVGVVMWDDVWFAVTKSRSVAPLVAAG